MMSNTPAQALSQLLAMYLGTLSLSLQPADRVDLACR